MLLRRWTLDWQQRFSFVHLEWFGRREPASIREMVGHRLEVGFPIVGSGTGTKSAAYIGYSAV